MNRLLKYLSALAAAALIAGSALIAPHPSQAAFGQFLCAPSPVDQFSARTIGGTNSFVPSGTLYLLNGQGCTFVAQQDVGAFQSQGFTGGQNFFTVSQTAITANQAASNSNLIVPAGTYIHNIVIQETTGNAITGGVDIGTAASGTQIVSAVTCGASCLVAIADSALSKRIFSTTASQQIFITCHTSCNSGSLNVSVLYSYF